jgi:BNR repeat-like domain
MPVAVTGPPHEVGVGVDHSAFPGLLKDPISGVLELVWRQGADHYARRNGRICRVFSTDNGLTYGNGIHLRLPPPDQRDPSIGWGRGSRHLTWFTGTNTAPAQGAWTMREWGRPVRMDPQLPYAATCAPIVQLPDNRLGGAFYGRKPGEAVDTAWMAWSTTWGVSWTSNRIANGLGAGRAYTEPYLVVDGSDIHLFFRHGMNDAIGVRSSPDAGGSWGPVRSIIDNATGRPTTLRTTTGALLMVYRALPTRAAAIAYSLDHAHTWLDGGVLAEPPAGSPLGMTYAAMVELDTGEVHVVYGMEQTPVGGAPAKSVLYAANLTVT